MLHTLNFSFLLPVIIIFFYFKKVKHWRILAPLLFYLLLFFFLNLFYAESKAILGKKLYYFVYTLLEYFTFVYIMWNSIVNKKFKSSIVFLSCLFTIFLIIFYSTVKIKRLDSVPIGIETIVLIVFIIYFFYLYFKNVSAGYIYENASFWLVTGILIYLGFTFFFNILANSLNEELFQKYFYYNYLGDILKNILFAVAVIFFARKKQYNSEKEAFNVPYLDMI